VTPYDPAPPPPPKTANNPFILLAVLVAIGAFLCLGTLFAWAVYRGYTRAMAEGAASPSGSARSPKAKLPTAERHVPHHTIAILAGCSDDDLRVLVSGIDGAIDVGAPLYNSGNFAGCYHLYEGAAADVERKLGGSCAGPVQALEAGRTRAASLTGASAQAWAMRDAFDGLLDVVARRRNGE
jgi:hypothetical protein